MKIEQMRRRAQAVQDDAEERAAAANFAAFAATPIGRAMTAFAQAASEAGRLFFTARPDGDSA